MDATIGFWTGLWLVAYGRGGRGESPLEILTQGRQNKVEE